MSRVLREIVIDPVAFQRMIGAKPTDEERNAIRNILTDLTDDPQLGYEIPFLKPRTYRVDAGRFRIHYSFDDHALHVGFIGVY